MFTERLTRSQIDHLDEMRRVLSQSLALEQDRDEMRGGMRFQAIKERDYLVRYSYDDTGKKVFRSLGPRSPETEELLKSFMHRREAWKQARSDVEGKLLNLGRFAKAHKLARMPVVMADALVALGKAGLFARDDIDGFRMVVAGSFALYAYECDLGYHLGTSVTRDRAGLDLVVVAPPDRDFLTQVESAVADALDQAHLVMDGDETSDDPDDGDLGFPLRIVALDTNDLDMPLHSRGIEVIDRLDQRMMAVARDGRAIAFPVVHPAIWLALARRGVDDLDIDIKLEARLDFVAKGYGVTAARLPDVADAEDEEGDMRLYPS